MQKNQIECVVQCVHYGLSTVWVHYVFQYGGLQNVMVVSLVCEHYRLYTERGGGVHYVSRTKKCDTCS